MNAATVRIEDLAPGLAGARMPLGDWPTPLRPIDVGGDEPLWVKDEGLAGDPYGGNKVRKLEWLLGDLPPGAPIVTAGAVGSNHVIATATYAARLGSTVDAVLNPQPDHPYVRRNAAVLAHLIRRAWPASGEITGGRALLGALLDTARTQRRRPRIIWVGGSTPRGVIGWADGALEISAQMAELGEDEPRRVYVPAGSGGIAAGLLLGLALAGSRTEVRAVRVADRMWANRHVSLLLARRAARLLAQNGATLPTIDPGRLVYDHRWFGGGYGVATDAGRAAAAIAARHGLEIEQTYSAKALAAAITAVRDPGTPGPIVWVNTANRRPLEHLVGGDIPPVPAELAHLLLDG